MKKTALVVCFFVLALSGVATALETCPTPLLTKEVFAKEKKWIIVPTHVNDAEGKPYLMKAFLHPTEVCGVMLKEADQSWCYTYWTQLEHEPWPLQDDEIEIYANPEKTMLIRITKDVLCKLMSDKQWRSFPTPDNDCEALWQRAFKQE